MFSYVSCVFCFISGQFSCLLSCSSSFIFMVFNHRNWDWRTKKKKKTGEPEPADGIFWFYDWVCQLALRWTGRKPHVPECQSCPDSAQTLHLLLQIVSTWFNVSRKKKRRRPSIIPHIIFTAFSIPYLAWWGFPDGSVGKESACNAGDPGLISGLGKSPGEGNGNPLQYFCLENRMDRGTPWATVHGSQRVRHS